MNPCGAESFKVEFTLERRAAYKVIKDGYCWSGHSSSFLKYMAAMYRLYETPLSIPFAHVKREDLSFRTARGRESASRSCAVLVA